MCPDPHFTWGQGLAVHETNLLADPTPPCLVGVGIQTNIIGPDLSKYQISSQTGSLLKLSSYKRHKFTNGTNGTYTLPIRL